MLTALTVPPTGVMETIPLAAIRTDGGTQARLRIRAGVVHDYAQAMKLQACEGGMRFPAIVVFRDGSDCWLADGFHRVAAAQEAGLSELAAEVRPGRQRDALLFSISSNAEHGCARTNADKRHAVSLLLGDPEWSQWSDREIARRCGVNHHLVRKLRHSASGRGAQMQERKVRRGDQIYDMKSPRHTLPMAGHKHEPTAEPKPLPLQDPLGLPLSGSMVDAFATLPDFLAARDLYAELATLMNRLARAPGGALYRQQLRRKVEHGEPVFDCPELCASLKKLIVTEPYCSVCPYCYLAHPGCNVPQCRACQGRGWINRPAFDACPERHREEILKLKAGSPA